MATAYSQEVLQLADDQQSPMATLQEMEWLSGYWVGSGLGGDCEELWLPAVDNSMAGVFRFVSNGKIIFTEYMSLEEREDSLVIRLKHFSRELNPWEEKDQWIEFPLVKIDGQTAYFDGLTYQRKKERLTIKIILEQGEAATVETFELVRKSL